MPEDETPAARSAPRETPVTFAGTPLGELRSTELEAVVRAAAIALRWRDVDSTGQTIRVRANFSEGELVTSKRGKVRSVPLVGEVAAALASLGRREVFTADHDRGDPHDRPLPPRERPGRGRWIVVGAGSGGRCGRARRRRSSEHDVAGVGVEPHVDVELDTVALAERADPQGEAGRPHGDLELVAVAHDRADAVVFVERLDHPGELHVVSSRSMDRARRRRCK